MNNSLSKASYHLSLFCFSSIWLTNGDVRKNDVIQLLFHEEKCCPPQIHVWGVTTMDITPLRKEGYYLDYFLCVKYHGCSRRNDITQRLKVVQSFILMGCHEDLLSFCSLCIWYDDHLLKLNGQMLMRWLSEQFWRCCSCIYVLI